MMRAMFPEYLLLRFSPPDLGKFDLATHSKQKLNEMREQTDQYLRTKEAEAMIPQYKRKIWCFGTVFGFFKKRF
jgi:hypothetical protein